MRPLPDRTLEAMSFICSYIKDRGYPPSIREIGRGIGLSSPGTMWKIMQKCEHRGYVEIDRSIPRGLRVTELGKELVNGAPGRI